MVLDGERSHRKGRKSGAKVPRFREPFWTALHHPPHTPGVLFMVIEKFKDGDPAKVGERFAQQGRMLPEGVSYEVSWLDEAGTRCFQVMTAPDRASLEVWMARWSDLVDFEVVPVLTSKEFWARR
jgi:hypothetical protein